jgi:putative MATE family efflux protein
MTDQNTNAMIDVPVNKMLLRMAIPISLGMMSTFMFQVVDTYFVGQLGSAELAALAFSSSAYLLFLSVFMGLAVGVSAVVANTIGTGHADKARGLTMISLAFVLVLSVALGFGARALIGPMFTGLGADATILPLIKTYMGILYLSFPFLMLGIIGSGAARAIGVTKETEIIFGIAGLINLVFDYLLIFGIGPFPELGLAGAAWATAMSFAFIFVGTMTILWRHGLIGFTLGENSLTGLRSILKFSVPTISMQILVPATGMLTTFLLAGYGSEAVAAFGVAGRIEALAMIGIFAVSMSVTPFIAQNIGAGAHDRVDQAIIFAGKSSIYIGIVLFVVLALMGPSIARVFSDDPDVIRFVSLYFKIVALSYGFQGIVSVTAAIFNGLQMPRIALKLMAIRTFGIVFPLLVLGAQFGLWWILIALTVGNIIAAIYAGKLMRAYERKASRPIADALPLAELIKDIRRLFRLSTSDRT